jgi:hypothetical protein
MFSFLKSADVDEKEQAQALFEKITATPADAYEARDVRSARLRMGMLCRAHLDKTFIDGAQRTALFFEKMAKATVNNSEKPEEPEFSLFQRIKSGDKEIWVYLPEEYAMETFKIGALYQKTDIDAKAAIERVQHIADQICLYELKLNTPFEALQFLRNEISDTSADSSPVAGNTPAAAAD